MGLLEIMQNALKGLSSSSKKGPKQKCPNCGEQITINMERCPKCGIHISSMFRRKCPKCSELNDLSNKKCLKCNYDFQAELERATKTYFVCPICGFKSEAYLTQCPACNTRFV